MLRHPTKKVYVFKKWTFNGLKSEKRTTIKYRTSLELRSLRLAGPRVGQFLLRGHQHFI